MAKTKGSSSHRGRSPQYGAINERAQRQAFASGNIISGLRTNRIKYASTSNSNTRDRARVLNKYSRGRLRADNPKVRNVTRRVGRQTVRRSPTGRAIVRALRNERRNRQIRAGQGVLFDL